MDFKGTLVYSSQRSIYISHTYHFPPIIIIDTRFLDSGLFASTLASNAIDPIKNYGPIESKFNYPQQPTSLAEAAASSFFSSSGSSPISPSSSPLSSNVIPPLLLNQQSSWLSDSPPPPLPPKIENFSDRPRSKSEPSIKKSKQGGRKRSIIFEEEEAEIQRKEFLERNRIAASKCRQKKKKWMKDLEINYNKLFTQNERLRSMIMVYQNEANSLKSELLARDGLCSCANMVRTVKKKKEIGDIILNLLNLLESLYSTK
ncbi:unnamed protein product [Absidia cylindrospora]